MGILAKIFLSIVNISFAGTIAAILLLIIKRILRNKLNPAWHYYIWLLLVIRLIVPVFPQSSLSLFNFTGKIQQELTGKIFTNEILIANNSPDNATATENKEIYPSGNELDWEGHKNNTSYGASEGIDYSEFSNNTNINNNTDSTSLNKAPGQGVAQLSGTADIIGILSLIWFLGVIGFLTYACILNIHINYEIKKCPSFADTVEPRVVYIFEKCKDYLAINRHITPLMCDNFGSPCLFGLIKPKLLVPSVMVENMAEKHLKHIFLHELMHLKRKDMALNTVLIILKAVYWFNPLFWYCFSKIHIDCEVSCDESVMLRLNDTEWIEYGKTILETSRYYSHIKPSYSVVGMVNKKSDTQRRILKAINFKKPSSMLISLAIGVTLLVGIVMLTDGVINPSNDVMTENGSIDFKITSGEEYAHYRKENSITALKRDSIVRTGPGNEFGEWCVIPKNTIIQLTGMLNAKWWTAKSVAAIGSPQEEDFDGKSSNNIGFLETDNVEFWINKDDFYYLMAHDKPLSLSSVSTNDAEEYSWIIKTDRKSEELFDPDNTIELQSSPSADSMIVGYAFNNDLVRIKKDDERKIIKHNEWILIEKVPFYYSNSSDIGWVKEAHIVELTEEMQPLQGFISRNTLIYTEPSFDSQTINEIYPELKWLKYSPISCIHIHDTKGDWCKVSAGVNSFTGWIPKGNIFYKVTDEIKNDIYHPEPDLDMFVLKLQEEIRNNSSFTIKAEDTNDILRPNLEQRNMLADSIITVSDVVMFDGGITDYREAAYPFYRLEFESGSIPDNIGTSNGKSTYSMVVTVENSLLLMMGSNTCYDYGIGRAGMPVRFVTPNVEFIQKIEELLPSEPNNLKNSINYLLNAKQMEFKGDYTMKEAITAKVQINKCVRAIKYAMGEEIPVDSIVKNIESGKNDNTETGDSSNEDTEKKYLFEFKFDDGTTIVLTYTNNYIEYDGKYYKPLTQPESLISGLFAAYF